MRKIPFYKHAPKNKKHYIKPAYKIMLYELETEEQIPFASATSCCEFLGLSNTSCLRKYTSINAIIEGKVYAHKTTGKQYKIRRIS